MENDKDQTVEKDDETVTSAQEGTQETSAVTNRPNIDVNTAKNKEEVHKAENHHIRKQE